MERRDFFRDLALLSAGTIILPQALSQCNVTDQSKRSLKGFIVSDAHFGWENEQQPAVEFQRQMMQRIIARFPDLDMVIDTGDAHHNGRDRDKDRGNWTEYLANQVEGIPFYYVPGNHEITHANFNDTESVCNELGSLTCRPYYSWDMCGIHFVSMPELIRAVYLSRELLEWVKLDLAINSEKTTVLLSHNNIIGTTGPFQPGYRGLVNSQEVFELMKDHPNVVAWMHGHNHNYEIVEKEGKLFVSNGRIGGFDPSKGKYGLGGIFFEINEEGMNVQCYSAEFDTFIEEIEGSGFSKVLNFQSSFDPESKPAYSYGKGCAVNGEKIPVYHHHLYDAGEAELFLTGVSGNTINEDPEIKYYMERKNPSRIHKQLMGYGISGNNENYEFMDPGLKILPLSSGNFVTLTAQREGHNQYTYYRISPGQSYRVDIEASSEKGGQVIKPVINIWKSNGDLIKSYKGSEQELTGGTQKISFSTDPVKTEEAHDTIYENENSDLLLNLSAEFEITGSSEPVLINSIRISVDKSSNNSHNAGIIYRGQKFTSEGSLSDSEIKKKVIPAPGSDREVVTLSAEGNGLCTWLIRNEGCKWQIRNAAVKKEDGAIVVEGLRNRWMPNNEIMISPTGAAGDFYLQKTSRLEGFHYYYETDKSNEIRVKVQRVFGDAGMLEFHMEKQPVSVKGCNDWKKEEKKLICYVQSEADVGIKLG